jgi:type IV secretory pathway TrbD component
MARYERTVTIATVAVHRIGRIEIMLEWRPRLIALVALTALLAVALASGYGIPFADNWEW